MKADECDTSGCSSTEVSPRSARGLALRERTRNLLRKVSSPIGKCSEKEHHFTRSRQSQKSAQATESSKICHTHTSGTEDHSSAASDVPTEPLPTSRITRKRTNSHRKAITQRADGSRGENGSCPVANTTSVGPCSTVKEFIQAPDGADTYPSLTATGTTSPLVSPLPRFRNLDRLQQRARIRSMVETVGRRTQDKQSDTSPRQCGSQHGVERGVANLVVPFRVTETKQTTVLRHTIFVKIAELSTFSVRDLNQQLASVLHLFPTDESFRTCLRAAGASVTDSDLRDAVRAYIGTRSRVRPCETASKSDGKIAKNVCPNDAIPLFIRTRPKRRLAAANITSTVLH
eukprot:m.1248778 g.1248778  ORF g.1248778 m.1248778 type:complete len:345 (+) comp24700_c0_seq2:180-1214(+)